VTYEGEGVSSLERVLPLIDYVEVTPDGVAEDQGGGAVLNGAAMANIKAVSSKAKVLVHGVGLSIGSHEGYSEQYITLLDQFVKQVDVHWHSEHLGYTMVDKENLGTMLAVPKTQEVLDMICKRVSEIQDRYDLPFLLENVVHILPDYPGDYSEAEFLNALVEKTGCGLLLDVYNLECDAHNHGFDIDRFLDELDLEYVREIHVACGVEHRGLLLDIHSRRLRDSTVRLMRKVVDSAQGAVEVVTYELVSEAVPVLGHDLIAEELKRLREALL
jgi:uncharacterized protein (UPF0276 family)